MPDTGIAPESGELIGLPAQIDQPGLAESPAAVRDGSPYGRQARSDPAATRSSQLNDEDLAARLTRTAKRSPESDNSPPACRPITARRNQWRAARQAHAAGRRILEGLRPARPPTRGLLPTS